MQARATLFEIDTLRASRDEAMRLFRSRVMPHLQAAEGFKGAMVLETPEGKGILLSFWESAEALETSLQTGFYDEQVAELMMFLRQPPGREHYTVTFSDIDESLVRLGEEIRP